MKRELQIQEIKEQLAGFNEEEFLWLCQVHYPDVYYRQFSTGMTQSQRIRLLIEEAERKTGLPTLLSHVKSNTDPALLSVLQLTLDRFQLMPNDEMPPVANLPIGSRVPYSVNPHFVGRQTEMCHIAQSFKGDQDIAIGQMAGVTGWGGIGKTQLAAAFAHRYGQYFAGGVYWINCANPDLIGSEISNCAGAVEMPLQQFLTLDEPTRLQLVQRAWQQEIPRLLVFDNCEDPKLVSQWRPKTGGCRLLVTSRYSGWESSFGLNEITLEILHSTESIALLRQLAPRLNKIEAGQVAEAVGHFPLALYLAGSFLNQRPDRTVEIFLKRFEEKKLSHRAMQGKRMSHSPTDHVLNVAATFALSWEQLDPTNPTDQLAIELMSYAIHLAPNSAIPLNLMQKIVMHARDEDGEQDVVDTYDMADDIQDALHELMALGLTPPDELRLHNLIIDFVAEKFDSNALNSKWEIVARSIYDEASTLNDAGYPALLREWLDHLSYMADNALAKDVHTYIYLADVLGFHIQADGNYKKALPYYQISLDIQEELWGENHPSTAMSLNNLGALLRAIGDYEGAQLYHEKALAISEEVLGENHLDTAMNLNNLGGLLARMGDYEGARPYYVRALAIYEKVLGAKHADTAMSLNNLGLLLQEIGDYEGARAYYERALAISEEALGAMHPSTARILNNLGGVLETEGDYKGAFSYLEKALVIREEVLGIQHPDTARSLNSLGALLDSMGKYEEAHPYYERALVIQEAVLGAMHPDTASSLNNLGLLFDNMGDSEKARPYLEKALAISEEVLGEKHPDTASSLNNLGALLDSMGKYEEAHPYYERALIIREEVLGAMHINTAFSLNNLGMLLKNTGKYEEALPYLERALTIIEELLGAKHPDTAMSLNNLGALLDSMGDSEKARPYLERAWVIREEVLGAKHPDTASSLNNLGMLLKNIGDYEESLGYLERVLAIRKEVLGFKHPDTASVLNNLGTLLRETGEHKKSKEYYEYALQILETRFGHKHPKTKSVQGNLQKLLEIIEEEE